jgi:signal transduction histidine kinase/CheY-like chemotaxis protein
MSPEVGAEFRASTVELFQSTSRTLIAAIGGLYLVCFLATAAWPEQIGAPVLLIAPVIIPTFLITLYLLPKRFWVAQTVWQVGLAAAITLAVYLFQSPEVAFLYALLPMIAVVTMGWPAGLIVEVEVAVLAWGLVGGLLSGAPSVTVSIGIVVAGALSWLVGWASTRSLLTVTQWALASYKMSRQKADEALEQRLEFKQTQDDLLRANQELARLSDRLKVMQQVTEEARQTKEEFVANVSHELRTPLNMIIGFSEMLLQSASVYGTELSPHILADIAAIERNSLHLSRLVDDVLDLSQIDAGRMALSKEWASLQATIEAAVSAVGALYESKGLWLRTEIHPDLPSVFCDGTRIRQVLINLLSNAGRFTERGGVLIHGERKRDEVVLSVSDTGPGIAPEDQERLFEPFQQLDGSIRRRHGGSGLGLSISKRFVEMHGGRMWLESPAEEHAAHSGTGGPGTTFHFSLPLDESLPMLVGAGGIGRWFSPYSEYEYRDHTRRSKAPALELVPRFVILEREDMLHRLFGRYAGDVEIVSVADIQEAIRELSRSPAQALLVNASPDEQLALVQELSGLPYETPALACWVPGEDDAAERLGVVQYLVKPVTRQRLLATLDTLGQDVRDVLLVDDEREALQLFSRMLSSAETGYRILRARSGDQALRLLRERQPDIMLLDLVMPGMDGFGVLQEKRQDPSIKDIPVVVLSSRDPSNEPIVSNTLTILRGRGLTVRDLLLCTRAVSEVLSPSEQPARQEQRETPVV